MFVLDTNVISEVIKPDPEPAVLSWLDHQQTEQLFLTSVTWAELSYGLEALPKGKRKQRLKAVFDELNLAYQGRVLPFDLGAANHFAELALAARGKGLGFPLPDGYIAAIAASRRMTVVTRDVAPYAAAGVAVINPWLM